MATTKSTYEEGKKGLIERLKDHKGLFRIFPGKQSIHIHIGRASLAALIPATIAGMRVVTTLTGHL